MRTRDIACPAHDPSARAMDTRARVYIITGTQKMADLANNSLTFEQSIFKEKGFFILLFVN